VLLLVLLLVVVTGAVVGDGKEARAKGARVDKCIVVGLEEIGGLSWIKGSCCKGS